MTLSEALDIVVGQTGHERFRELCDPGHPAYHPGTAAVVFRWARGEALSEPPSVRGHGETVDGPGVAVEPSRPPVAGVIEFHRRMRACEHWQRSSGCGCGLNRCALGKGRAGVVSHEDCRICLES